MPSGGKQVVKQIDLDSNNMERINFILNQVETTM